MKLNRKKRKLEADTRKADDDGEEFNIWFIVIYSSYSIEKHLMRPTVVHLSKHNVDSTLSYKGDLGAGQVLFLLNINILCS